MWWLCMFAEDYDAGFLRRRYDHRRLWRNAFKTDDLDRVDSMLIAICDEFGLPAQSRYRLRPSDDLWRIYKEKNWYGVDDMEFEFLAMRLEEQFGIPWDEFESMPRHTIGALVRRIATPIRMKRDDCVEKLS